MSGSDRCLLSSGMKTKLMSVFSNIQQAFVPKR